MAPPLAKCPPGIASHSAVFPEPDSIRYALLRGVVHADHLRQRSSSASMVRGARDRVISGG